MLNGSLKRVMYCVTALMSIVLKIQHYVDLGTEFCPLIPLHCNHLQIYLHDTEREE